MYHHLLIPTDGSALATTAVKQGLDFAKAVGAEVTVLPVHEPFHILTHETEMVTDTYSAFKEHSKKHAKSILEKVETLAEARNIKCELLDLESDYPYEAIINTAKKKKCDLIAMASHGHGGVKAMILGSETQKVVAHSTIPVLVYR